MESHHAAKVLLLNSKNEILVLIRSNTHPKHPGNVDLPGGVIKQMEPVLFGLKREIFEETNIHQDYIKNFKLLYTVKSKYKDVLVIREIYGSKLNTDKINIKLSFEHQSYKWEKIHQLKDFEQPYQQGIDYIKKNRLLDNLK